MLLVALKLFEGDHLGAVAALRDLGVQGKVSLHPHFIEQEAKVLYLIEIPVLWIQVYQGFYNVYDGI